MRETELRFLSLQDLIQFKQLTAAKELRIDTAGKSLTGKFTEAEVNDAVRMFRAITIAC